MFTGIISDVGQISEFIKAKDFQAKIFCSYKWQQIDLGCSISCDGVCLTVIERGIEKNQNWFKVEVSEETVSKTNIGDSTFGWAKGKKINLERALKIGDELGGHIVTGHVDGTGIIDKIREIEGSTDVTFKVSEEIIKFIAQKGSVTINGTSLTINQVNENYFNINLIPHTKKNTNWNIINLGEKVNIEIDILARYVDKILKTEKKNHE